MHCYQGQTGYICSTGSSTLQDLTHLEYAIPAWANISEKDLEKLEKVQVQCLRRVIGAKAHSSSSAVV